MIRATLAPLSRRFGLPVASLVATVAAIVIVLSWDEAPGALLLVAAVGPPVSALLLVCSIAGEGVRGGRVVGAFILGGSVIPVAVILVHGAVLAAVFGLVEPLAEAWSGLFDDLRVDPELVEVLANPWALVILVQLAVVAPLVEETLKPVGARLVRPGSRREAFVVGAAAGAGFAAIEDVLYASGWFYSFDWWLPVAVLRSTGAALHLLGAGLISVAWFERRAGTSPRTSIIRMWGIGVAVHALWNGSIAVAIVLFEERSRLGFIGGSDGWGTGLFVMLAALGMALLGALAVAARWATPSEPGPLMVSFDPARPEMIAGWAGLAALLIVPAVVMILVFPGFIAL